MSRWLHQQQHGGVCARNVQPGRNGVVCGLCRGLLRRDGGVDGAKLQWSVSGRKLRLVTWPVVVELQWSVQSRVCMSRWLYDVDGIDVSRGSVQHRQCSDVYAVWCRSVRVV